MATIKKNDALTSIGCKVSYAFETAEGVRPTTGYIVIHGIKSTGDLNPQPNTADTTDFDNERFTTKTPILSDLPDSVELTANLGNILFNTWQEMVKQSKEKLATGLRTWFCIDVKGFENSLFFAGDPQSLGLPEIEVNSGIEISLYIVPTGEPVYEKDPTYADETTPSLTSL